MLVDHIAIIGYVGFRLFKMAVHSK